MSRRGLKCPHCKQQTARLRYGYNEELHRQYHQKFCPACGYEGRNVYFGVPITPKQYAKKMDKLHKEISARLAREQK